MHTHRGREVVLVLQGVTREGETIYRAGELCEMPDGSSHATKSVGEDELIYAVVVPDVEIDGIPLPPVE